MRRVVIIILTLVLLVLAGIGGGVAWWIRRDGPAPVLLIQHDDGNLILADEQGELRPLTTDADGRSRFYAFPVPAPDGRSVAYVETLHGTDVVTSSLVVQRLHGDPRSVFDSPTSRPFYLHWSPDGKQIAFLASDHDTMLLRTVNTIGNPAPQEVILGQPSYFSWTPDSQRLLLHTNGSTPQDSLALWTLGDKTPRRLDTHPALFQAPAWLSDGHSAIAAVADGQGVALARLGEDGRIQKRMASTQAGMLFVVSPDGTQVAYVPVGAGSAGNLHLVAVDGTGDQEIASGPVVTCLWSPGGKRLAFITLAGHAGTGTVALRQEAPPRLVWNVFDLGSHSIRPLKSFVPSTEFLGLLPFYDQYAQSIRLWDKAGRHLVYADERGVWTLDVESSAAARVDAGVVGMWIER